MISAMLNALRRSTLVALAVMVLGLGVLTPFAALAQDAASQNAAPAADTKAEAARFVASYAASTDKDATARWLGPICIRVVGLEPEQAAAVRARVEEVAKGVGLAVMPHELWTRVLGSRQPATSRPCTDNIQIGFTKDPQAMLAGALKRPGAARGDRTSNTRDIKTVTLPIQAWYETNGVQAARYDRPDAAQNPGSLDRDRLKVPVVWQYLGNPDQGAAYVPPGSCCDSGANTGNGSGQGLTGYCCSGFPGGTGGGPYYRPALNHRAFRDVLVIVDGGRTDGKSLGLISDYVAMLALSQPRALGTCQALPSITDLFADCGRPAPDGLTPADNAFLTALNGAPLSKTADIAERMAKILDQTRMASR